MLARVPAGLPSALRLSRRLNRAWAWASGGCMQLLLELGVADLAATRFAVSPLHETLRALPLLADPGRSAVNRPWVRWALAELDRRTLRLPRVWPLIVTDLPYWPEFLFPAPAVRAPGLDAELVSLC